MFAISLINEIFVAKKAFEAYLIISAVRISVLTIGQRSGAYNSSIAAIAFGFFEPRTTRSGRIKSPIADPSRRNSGFETTLKSNVLPFA